MTKKKKPILEPIDQKVIKKTYKYFSDEQKHFIIQEFLDSGSTKQEIWEKYTGDVEEHGQILRWMRHFGYVDGNSNIRRNFVPKLRQMKDKKEKCEETETFETLKLKKRIKELEKQLKDAEMKSIAYSTMVDIAEKEFNIPIRKKSNTKS